MCSVQKVKVRRNQQRDMATRDAEAGQTAGPENVRAVSSSAQIPLLVWAAVATPRQHFSAVVAPAVFDIHAVRRLVFVLERPAVDNP